jgi:hypothetical protein
MGKSADAHQDSRVALASFLPLRRKGRGERREERGKRRWALTTGGVCFTW